MFGGGLSRRFFSTGRTALSNIGSAPILIPEGAALSLSPRVLDGVTKMRLELDKRRNGKPKIYLTKTLDITGPRGSLSLELADFVRLEQDKQQLEVHVNNPREHSQRAMWGTSRSLINNGIIGVTEGHLCIVKFVGTGFRATLENDKHGKPQLSLRVGYCVPKIVPVPEGVTVKIPVPHRIIIEGCDKQQVKLLAAEIRKHRKPEPYKGKGIFVDDETIKLKQKKIK